MTQPPITTAAGDLVDLLPDVRDYIRRHVPADWPELAAVLAAVTDQPLGPLMILPLASAAAAGGDPADAVPVAAAWAVLSLAARILDDLQDQDRPDALWLSLGPARTFNACGAMFALCTLLLAEAGWPPERHRTIAQIFAGECLHLAAGQDRDLRGPTTTLDDYWQLIGDKNASAYALACAAGAACGTGDAAVVAACRTYGYHLGLVHQLFDDFEGVWDPGGVSDIARGRVTLPLLYALSVDHPRRAELEHLVAVGPTAAEEPEIRAILDLVPARDFVLWAALQERDLALAALDGCPGSAGVAVLGDSVTMLFAHLDELRGDPCAAPPEGSS